MLKPQVRRSVNQSNLAASPPAFAERLALRGGTPRRL
jgi:hypothetical protein